MKIRAPWTICFSYWSCMRLQNLSVLLFPSWVAISAKLRYSSFHGSPLIPHIHLKEFTSLIHVQSHDQSSIFRFRILAIGIFISLRASIVSTFHYRSTELTRVSQCLSAPCFKSKSFCWIKPQIYKLLQEILHSGYSL